MKDVDHKILAELMKNTKISDRQLSKATGVSQPTVTRRRTRLENDLIEAYTTIPKHIGDAAAFVVDLTSGVISKPLRFEYLSKVE